MKKYVFYGEDSVRLECIRLILEKSPKLMDFVFEDVPVKPSMATEKILRELGPFSSGEQVLVKLALDFWNGSAGTPVMSVIERLSEENFIRAIKAMLIMRKI